jgi:hypothetical protein
MWTRMRTRSGAACACLVTATPEPREVWDEGSPVAIAPVFRPCLHHVLVSGLVTMKHPPLFPSMGFLGPCFLQAEAEKVEPGSRRPSIFSARAQDEGPRKLRRNRWWTIGVCLKLTLPLLLSCSFFGLVYLRMAQVTEDTHSSSLVTSIMGDRTVRCVCVCELGATSCETHAAHAVAGSVLPQSQGDTPPSVA